MTSSETGLPNGEGTVGFEMASDLFIYLALERQGKIDIGL
jgi:hypothetical protein